MYGHSLPRLGTQRLNRLENGLHVEVCKGNITLEDAQNQIKTNLASAVQKEFW